jgi:predicted RND superfamily exporter protein
MASGTALGLMFFFGTRFGSILCVTPFLVLAIGVDDAYLMIHTWQRISKELREHPSNDDSVAQRLSLVLIDTGPAILISALTNILADAVGSFTGSPEVTLLCMGNMVSIFVDFIYQITFYSAVMAIVGKWEMRSEAIKSQKNRYKLSIPIGDASLKMPEIKRVTSIPQKRMFFEV